MRLFIKSILLFFAAMQGGKEKKLTVLTKNIQSKKPALEIDTNADPEVNSKMALTHPLPIHSDDPKTIVNLTSPSNAKVANLTVSQQSNEHDTVLKKPQQQMQKKGSLKQSQPALSKIQQQKAALNGFVSPKAAFNKDKVMISYASEKNLGPGFKAEKKDSKAVKIQQLQKIIEESKIKQSQLSQRQSELRTELQKLRTENAVLLAQTVQLKKRIQKYRISNEETKKMLKQRIHSFNQQGGEMQALRTQIKTLQDRVQTLLTENQNLKAQLNKFSQYTPKELSALRGSMATSAVREVQLQGSRVSQLYLKQSGDQLLEFANLQRMEENLDLQSYISEAQESYLQEYKNNVEIFDSIKSEYQNILHDIQTRYGVMVQDFQNAAKAQAGEIYELQAKIDELTQQRDTRLTPALSLTMDQHILRSEKQIATLNLLVFDLRAQNKELLQDIQHHRAQCRFLSAELDIERLKRQFRNENDKFQYNVVKLNLLGIIDKLKMQIDKEKAKCNKLSDKYQALRAKQQVEK